LTKKKRVADLILAPMDCSSARRSPPSWAGSQGRTAPHRAPGTSARPRAGSG
jgi:hypothetical protein